MKNNLAICFVLLQSFAVYAPYDGFKGVDSNLQQKPIAEMTDGEIALLAQRYQAQKAVTEAMTPEQRRYEDAIIEGKNAARLAEQRRKAGH